MCRLLGADYQPTDNWPVCYRCISSTLCIFHVFCASFYSYWCSVTSAKEAAYFSLCPFVCRFVCKIFQIMSMNLCEIFRQFTPWDGKRSLRFCGSSFVVYVFVALSGLRGCKNRACSISWLEVVKGISNQVVACFVSWGSFFMFIFCVSGVCSVLFPCFWLSVPAQCNQLPGKTRLWNDVLCVEWDVKIYNYIFVVCDMTLLCYHLQDVSTLMLMQLVKAWFCIL